MGLWQNFQNEQVRRLALREAVTAASSASVRDAVTLMREKKLGCTIIADEERKPLGIFTESALTQLMNDRGTSALDHPLADHMLTPCPHVCLSDPISYVVEAMELKNLRFLCVVDDEGRIAGLTGQKGLIEFVADHFPGQIMVQRIGGEPFPSEREGA